MFNRKSFGLLASLCLASASSPYISGMPTPTPDACTSACGSAASSSNPYGDMSNLLKSGINCPSPYNPLSPQSGQNQYGYSGDSCIIPGYYPQQGSGSGYPGMNGGPGTTPISGMSSNDECEVTTSIECKPKKGGSQNYFSPPTYSSYSLNSSMIPMGNIIGGNGASTKPYTVPGSSQACDCSQFIGGMTNGGGYPSGPQPYPSGSDGCNCSQIYNQNGINGQSLPGGNGNGTSPTPGGFLPGQTQKQPSYCGSNSGSGCKGGPFDNNGFIGGRTPGSVFNSFDCCKPQTYQPSPIKTAIIGTTELPISDNFRAMSSSCGPAPCF